MPTRSIDLGQVESIVQDFYLPVIVDNYFLSNAIYYRLRESGRVKMYNGARAIVQPLSFAPEGGGGQWWGGVDVMDVRVRNPITAATYYRKNYSTPLTITRDEEDAVGNDGHKIVDLVDAKMNIAKPTAVDAVGTELFNDGSDPKKIGGLQHMIRSAPTATHTYGGITVTTTAFTWWQNQADATAYVTGPASTFAGTRGFGPIGRMWVKIRRASGKSPTMIVSNYGTYQDYHDALAGPGFGASTANAGGQRYVGQDTKLASAGFENVKYKTAVWVPDERAPHSATHVEQVFFIHEPSLWLVIHSKRNMSFDGWYTPHDQRAQVGYIDWSGEFCASERRCMGVVSAVNATLTS